MLNEQGVRKRPGTIMNHESSASTEGLKMLTSCDEEAPDGRNLLETAETTSTIKTVHKFELCWHLSAAISGLAFTAGSLLRQQVLQPWLQ